MQTVRTVYVLVARVSIIIIGRVSRGISPSLLVGLAGFETSFKVIAKTNWEINCAVQAPITDSSYIEEINWQN
jgi:hypothetical protein